MKTKFEGWENCLTEETAEKLYTDFVENEKPVPWSHRGFGRFVHDLTDTVYGQAVKDQMITDPTSPYYNNQAWAQRCSIWIQCFVPGGVLPLHREFVRSVSTVYLSKNLWEETQSGFMEWHEQDEIDKLHSGKVHKSLPKFNTGNYYVNPDPDGADKVWNPWHRVHRNNATYKRYSLQMFEPVMEATKAIQIVDSIKMVEQGYLQVLGWDKAMEHYNEEHPIFDYSCWHPEIFHTWANDNKDIIESMTL